MADFPRLCGDLLHGDRYLGPLAFAARFWPALVAVLLVGAVLILVRCSGRAQDNAVTQARDAGASQVRERAASETLSRTLEANNAAEAVRRDPVARRDGCVRHSRTPQNCD
ncbi:MAG TPA: hypothetical protein VF503_24345 [Sphingobium sp.]|uniref:hypothetical protein n=1 Tax=Sphingobium sp. TaxID=1912891 RepID=UPI002ED06DA1